MPNILICTLGSSWAVIPEAYAFLAPQNLKLYLNHPEYKQLLNLKNQYKLQATDEIWVCTTQGTQKSLQQLKRWQENLPTTLVLRTWQTLQPELSSREECRSIRELIVRTCLLAQDYSQSGQVVLSLAGGRKTMSADLQWAGSLFGCDALLHIISAEPPLPQEFIQASPEIFTKPLPVEWIRLITPLIVGQSGRSDLLDIETECNKPIISKDYPLTLPSLGQTTLFEDCDYSLSQELLKRQQLSSHLLGNFLQQISADENHENWRSLYRLSPRSINTLRTTRLEIRHQSWLKKLPKADLHRHLGGCLDLCAQKQVARIVWESLTPDEQRTAQSNIEPLLQQAHWPWDWPDRIKQQGNRCHNTVALLIFATDPQLQHNLWQVTEPRIALKTSLHGFSAYERPGELTGSALLSHPVALKPYIEFVLTQAQDEGIAYLELRGSPQKYGDGLDFLERLYNQIIHNPLSESLVCRFVVILDRRCDPKELEKTIQMAITARKKMPDFIVGLDMAGDEQHTSPADVSSLFTHAFEYCLPITIHAGEGEPAESIWQAAYHLHADRIGHGLTINENPNLAQRFRDRNICLELCPSSNREVIGFFDPNYSDSWHCPKYPLIDLWRNKGLPLTICTDNPGISRTTLADEYLTAARMTGHQLTLWEILAMIKQGFVHAFISSQQKERFLKQIDGQMYRILSTWGEEI